MRRSIRYLASFAAATAGCTGGAAVVAPATGMDAGADARVTTDASVRDGAADAATTPPRWTIFVYGHGDHSLSPSLVTDITKMSRASLGGNVTIIVEADFDSSRVVGMGPDHYPSGTTWYRIRGDGMPPEIIRTEPEKNLDDLTNLAAGVQYAFTQYPADRYGVIMWDHGGGWSGGFGGDSQDGTNPPPSNMSAPAAATALQLGLAGANIRGTRPLEFISFDTCLMAAPEVMRPFRDLANVYIANAEIDFGEGWNYAATLSYLATHTGDPMTSIAQQEVRDWEAIHLMQGPADLELRSHIAVDLTKFQAFENAMNGFVTALSSMPTAFIPAVARAAFTTRPQYSLDFQHEVSTPEFRDLGQFLGAVASTPGAPLELSQAVGPVQAALNAMTLGLSQGTVRTTAGQSGVHIGLPLPALFTPTVAANYDLRAGQWAQESRWSDLLAVLQPGSSPAPDIRMMNATLTNGTNATAAMPPTVTVMPMGDVIEGVMNVYQETAAPNVFLKLQPVDVQTLAAGTAAPLSWNLQLLQFAGQFVSVETYLSGGVDASGAMAPTLYAIPGVCSFYPNGLCRILVQVGTPVRAVAILLETGPGLTSAKSVEQLLTQFPTATFAPTISRVDGTGAALDPIVGVPVPLGSATFSTTMAPAGSYLLQTIVEDVYGRTSSRYDAVSVM